MYADYRVRGHVYNGRIVTIACEVREDLICSSELERTSESR